MPVQPMSFPTLSFADNNPFLMGMNNAQQYDANALANQINQVKAKYANQMTQEQLRKLQLANQASQAAVPYAGESAFADAYYKLKNAMYLGSLQQMYAKASPLGKTTIEAGGVPPGLGNLQANGGVPNNNDPEAVLRHLIQTANSQSGGSTSGSGVSGNDATGSSDDWSGITGDNDNSSPPINQNTPSQPTNTGNSGNPATTPNQIKLNYTNKLQGDTLNKSDVSDAKSLQILAKRLNTIDPNVASLYSGLLGHGELLAQKIGASIFGTPTSDDFKKYMQWQSKSKTLLDNLRQTLKTSIRSPYIQENLAPMLGIDQGFFASPDEIANKIRSTQQTFNDYAQRKTNAALNPLKPYNPADNLPKITTPNQASSIGPQNPLSGAQASNISKSFDNTKNNQVITRKLKNGKNIDLIKVNGGWRVK